MNSSIQIPHTTLIWTRFGRTEGVVLAADSGSSACVTGSNPDDIKRRAFETEEEVEALDDDTKEAEDLRSVV